MKDIIDKNIIKLMDILDRKKISIPFSLTGRRINFLSINCFLGYYRKVSESFWKRII